MNFLIHGSIANDLLLGFEGSFAEALKQHDAENLSVSFFAPRLTRHHGGTAANIAWNLTLLQQTPYIVGAVGHDGDEYLALLQSRGVQLDFVERRKDDMTAFAVIGTDDNGRQISFFHSGADAHASLPTFNGNIPQMQYGIVGARNPQLMIEGARQLDSLDIPFLFDPGQQAHILSKDEFRRAVSVSYGLIVNEYEWMLSSSTLQWQIDDVVGSCGLLVVTKGERGLTIHTEDGEEHVAACIPDCVVNPTGAGDALRAGFLVGRALDWSLADAARLGCALASFVVEQEGALLDSVDMDELKVRFENEWHPMPSLRDAPC